MPFDDTSIRTAPVPGVVGNTLAELGLTPIPQAMVDAHKAAVIRAFCQRGAPYRERVRQGAAAWRRLGCLWVVDELAGEAYLQRAAGRGGDGVECPALAAISDHPG